MDRRNFLDVARDFYNDRFTKAKCGFVAGSLVRGTGTATSDIDFYIVYDNKDLPNAYRETFFYEDYIIECFVQNENSLNHFLNEEPERGECVANSMVLEGIVLPANSEYSNKIKNKAESIYKSGPNILSKDNIDSRRYSITDLLDDIPSKNIGELQGTLAVLHQKLGDFYLRANGKWSGSRKSLYRIMNQTEPKMAARFVRAFDDAYKKEDFCLLMKLSDEILAPFGGRLMAGYKSIAPEKANLG